MSFAFGFCGREGGGGLGAGDDGDFGVDDDDDDDDDDDADNAVSMCCLSFFLDENILATHHIHTTTHHCTIHTYALHCRSLSLARIGALTALYAR